MTELETLSARLEEAVKKQTEADEAYHKAAEEVESIKAAMVELKKRKEKRVNELSKAGMNARKNLQEMCNLAYGDSIGKVSITVYIPVYMGDGPYEFEL
jgi:multidrug resistance efflux pump